MSYHFMQVYNIYPSRTSQTNQISLISINIFEVRLQNLTLYFQIFVFVDKFTEPLSAAMNPGYQGAQLALRTHGLY